MERGQDLTRHKEESIFMQEKDLDCGTMEGTLPGKCADMVFPYVPMQRGTADHYEQKQALENGTLFPGLDLPFFKATKAAMNCDDTALCELMALNFAITELNLYLDTHYNDFEARDLFNNYVKLFKEGKRLYEQEHGPLQVTEIPLGAYTWISDPWPWDKKGGNA